MVIVPNYTCCMNEWNRYCWLLSDMVTHCNLSMDILAQVLYKIKLACIQSVVCNQCFYWNWSPHIHASFFTPFSICRNIKICRCMPKTRHFTDSSNVADGSLHETLPTITVSRTRNAYILTMLLFFAFWLDKGMGKKKSLGDMSWTIIPSYHLRCYSVLWILLTDILILNDQ